MLELQRQECKFQSPHQLFPAFLLFNEGRDLFVTCGQDGYLYSYSCISYTIKKLRFIEISFKGTAIVSASWATRQIGSYIAVGSLNCQLALLSINERTGDFKIEEVVKLSHTISSIEWHPYKKNLIVSGKGDKEYLSIVEKKGESWKTLKISLKIQPSLTLATFGIYQSSPILLIASNRALYMLKNQSQKVINSNEIGHADTMTSNSFQPYELVRQKGIILSFLCSKTYKGDYLQVIVLTNLKFTVYRLVYCKKKTFVAQVVMVANLKKNYGKMQWGWNENQICLYQNLEMQDISSLDSYISPTIYKRQLNGFWREAQFQ